MSMLVGTKRALLGPRGLRYLLRATFNANDQGYTDSVTYSTAANGIQDGTLTVVEVDGTLAIVSNQLAFTAQGTPVWGDLGGHSQAITRALGRGLLTGFNLSTWEEMGLAWHSAAAVVDPDNAKHAWQANATDGRLDNGSGVAIWTGLATSTDYKLALVLGGFDTNETPYYAGQIKADYVYGCWLFLHDGTQWHLAWLDSTDNTATLYAMLSNLDAVGTLTLNGSDPLITPDKDLSAIQVPAAYSSFTAVNGTSLDAITPEVGGAWTEDQGNWDIQTNRANPDGAAAATVNAGIADALIKCVLQSAGGGVFILLRYSDINNRWQVGLDAANNEIQIWEVNGGVATKRANTAVAIAAATDYDVTAIFDGQTIDGFVDGGSKVTYGSAALNETATLHGMRSVNTNDEFDNWTCHPRTNSQIEAVLGSV